MNADNHKRLREAASALQKAAVQSRAWSVIRAAALDQLIHDAEAAEHRRAAFNAVDRAKYRLGSAFEVNEALDTDPVAFAGWLAGGIPALLLLVDAVLEEPNRSNGMALSAVLQSLAGMALRELGVRTNWRRLKSLYDAEVEAVQNSPFGRDHSHPARGKPPTARQKYLAREICRILQVELRTFATRGAAHDWLLTQGGNPRFWIEPPQHGFDEADGGSS